MGEHSGERGQGIVYLAFGSQFRREARRSIASVRKNCREVSIGVVTDRPWHGDEQPDVFVTREPSPGSSVKPRHLYEASPFERSLFLDTDTIVARDLGPVFGLLNHYDFGVRFLGAQLPMPPDLYYHPACNSGVLLFKRNEQVRTLFRMWWEDYQAYSTGAPIPGDPRRSVEKIHDQWFLPLAIARSGARTLHLGEFMNFALSETIVTYCPPAILHGRLNDMELLREELVERWDWNRDWQARLWLPNIRGLLPAGVRRSDPLLASALVLRRLANAASRWVRSKLRRRP